MNIEENREVERLKSIFNDLRIERIKNGRKIFPIDQKRKLKSAIFVLNFQGLIDIRYNKNFFLKKSSLLDDQCLRFILLHEEYHVKSGVFFDFLKVGAVLIPLLLIFNYFFKFIFVTLMDLSSAKFFFIFGEIISLFLFYSFLILCVFFSVLIPFFITYKIFYSKLYNDEFLADYYAAITLKESFSEDSPSVVIERALNALSEEKSKSSITAKILSIIFYFVSDYHPKKSLRIERIHNSVDAKKM